MSHHRFIAAQFVELTIALALLVFVLSLVIRA